MNAHEMSTLAGDLAEGTAIKKTCKGILQFLSEDVAPMPRPFVFGNNTEPLPKVLK
ncbi:unnamed protein product [Ilex paraguariensis]|uniref:Uncharacterized protein n=1 Tax=Ilex paraguariensis TaxID=185542 RepID=A0ABC8RDU5_9AQUA